jgi:hypothetical protein
MPHSHQLRLILSTRSRGVGETRTVCSCSSSRRRRLIGPETTDHSPQPPRRARRPKALSGMRSSQPPITTSLPCCSTTSTRAARTSRGGCSTNCRDPLRPSCRAVCTCSAARREQGRHGCRRAHHGHRGAHAGGSAGLRWTMPFLVHGMAARGHEHYSAAAWSTCSLASVWG